MLANILKPTERYKAYNAASAATDFRATVNPPPEGLSFLDSFFRGWLSSGSVLICHVAQILAQSLYFRWLSTYLSYGSILAQSLFVLWLNPRSSSVFIYHVAQSWLIPYLSCGSTLAQSLFFLWLNPGQEWATGQIMIEPGLSHVKNNDRARIGPWEK